jgi:uncharacterized protein YndB with AHSA1/START domain
MSTAAIAVPDLSARPLDLHVERDLGATPHEVYLAWTERVDAWFAAKDTVLMTARVNAPFFFETHHAPPGQAVKRHAHYGRFLRLEPDRLVQLTWVTGEGGTEGAETVVTVALIPGPDERTHVSLKHEGFPNEASRDGHLGAWPMILEHLDEVLSATGAAGDPGTSAAPGGPGE